MSRTRKTRRKSVLLFTIMSVGLLFVTVSYKKISLDSKKAKLENQKRELEVQKEDLEAENERINEYGNYVKSPKFIEDTAREKLGLVYPDEIVFEPEKE